MSQYLGDTDIKADTISEVTNATGVTVDGVLLKDSNVTSPIIIGGSATTSTLQIRPTSGAGTAGADVIFQSGTNGNRENMRILNIGDIGIGTAAPNAAVEIFRDGGTTVYELRLNNNDNSAGSHGWKLGFFQGKSNLEVGKVQNYYTGSVWNMRMGTYGATETLVLAGSGFIGMNGITAPAQALDINGFINTIGQKRVATQFDKTNATLANVTGLSVNVAASKTYRFESVLYVDADATGGSKYAIAGTATATSIIYEVVLVDNTLGTNTITSRQTALGGAAGQAGTTAGMCIIRGTITVNQAGTLTTQFAQNAANGTSSVLIGSTFIVENIA